MLIDEVIMRLKREGRPLSDFPALMDAWIRESEQEEKVEAEKKVIKKKKSSEGRKKKKQLR